jgi:hypothetical protein
MKTVHAVWEQRNLGVDCYEITVELNDTIDSVNEVISKTDGEYLVIKVPTEMSGITMHLQEKGFHFIETFINCVNMAELPKLSNVQKRIADSLVYLEMAQGDFDELFVEIKNNMFENDRVSIDNAFTQEQANNRYVGWIGDEISHGSKVYKMMYKGNVVGFFVLRKIDEKTLVAVLGGIYEKYRSYGFGFCMNYLQITEGIKQNVNRIKTSFSTNNRASSSMHFALNYNLEGQFYVFVNHRKGKI